MQIHWNQLISRDKKKNRETNSPRRLVENSLVEKKKNSKTKIGRAQPDVGYAGTKGGHDERGIPASRR